MKTVIFDASGQPISDFTVYQQARDFLLGPEEQIVVCNSTFIDSVRVMIHEKLFPNTEVVFSYGGEIILPDKNGRLPSWPAGFCDVNERLLERLLEPPPA